MKIPKRLRQSHGIRIGFLSRKEIEFIDDICLDDDYRVEIWKDFTTSHWFHVYDDWRRKSCSSDRVNDELIRVVPSNRPICEGTKETRKG